MATTTTDRLRSSGNLGMKAPCVVATTAAITLSGTQTINGVACVDGDRVLVKNQSSSIDNGIYICRATAWERAADFNGSFDAGQGMLVLAVGGTASPLTLYRLTTANDVNIGTDNITFAEFGVSRGDDGRYLFNMTTSVSTWAGAAMMQLSTLDGNSFAIINYDNATLGAGLQLCASGGTSIGQNVALADGAYMGDLVFQSATGDSGTPFRIGAYISGIVDGTVTSQKVPGRLSFYTAADNVDGSIPERMRIECDGKITLIGIVQCDDDTTVGATKFLSAGRLIVTGTTVPTNGLYLPAASKVGFATNTTAAGAIDSGQRLLWGVQTVISGANGAVQIQGTPGSRGPLSCYMNDNGAQTQIEFLNGNGVVGTIQTNGTATAYNTSSDYRLKENLTPISGATELLEGVPVYLGNFKATPGVSQALILAHELAAVVPTAVSGAKDAMRSSISVDPETGEETLTQVPDYQGVDFSKMVPLLVAAIQELSARIAQLEA